MKHNDHGFTLLEIMLAQTIVVVMMAVGYLVMRMVIDNFQTSVTASQSLFEVQETIHRMTRLIREARDAENGAYLLETVEDDELVFYGDIDQDGKAERVRFSLNGDTIEQGVVEPVGVPAVYDLGSEAVRVIITDVAMQGQTVFGYYNEHWPSPTGNPVAMADRLLDTRYVTVTVGIAREADTYQTDYLLQDGVQLRNAKTN